MAERIVDHEIDVVTADEKLTEARLEGRIDLDRMHMAGVVGEEGREDAEPRADLEHDVFEGELGKAAGDGDDVLVDQEVLAQLPLAGDRFHGSPKTADAFSSIR
jgi:hypothetical protein